jgi:hypothetical protein
MKKTLTALLTGLVALSIPAFVYAGEKAPQEVVDMAQAELAEIGTDPIIVAAVKAENEKGKTLGEIKEMDNQWKETPGIADYMQALMDSQCGRHLRKIQESKVFFSEIFVTDNQGANVAMTDKTSDYWQGDEAKFTETYKDGAGAIHISEVEFDDSSQTYLVQVSVPVKDQDKVIGVITFGIDLDSLE